MKTLKRNEKREFYYKSIVSAYYTVYHAAKALLLIKFQKIMKVL